MRDVLLDLMIIVCPQGMGDKILDAEKKYVNLTSLTRGRGTASSDVVAALGLGEPEKDVIFTFVEKSNVRKVYEVMEENFLPHTKGIIAMTVPVSAVGGNLTLQILLGNTKNLI